MNFPKLIGTKAILGAVSVLLLVACGSQSGDLSARAVEPVAVESVAAARTITLGDVDPDKPAKKIERFQPLANYLAENLSEFGIERGEVVIARDIEEMARFLREGKVDVYFDSAYPTLAAQSQASSQVIARRWKQDEPSYWSTFIAMRDAEVDSVQGFVGHVVSFDEPHSTSGFILPAGTLVQQGYSLVEVGSPSAQVDGDEIGYFFSQSDQTSIELLLQGRVAGAGISNQDYEELSEELKQQLVTFGDTMSVTRSLVSVRPGLEPALVEQIRALLFDMDKSDHGQQILVSLKKTKKFDALPLESEAALTELRGLMDLLVD